jgi:hypothetical protein
MRYQERIYIQTENSAIRNKTIPSVNMSSDICVFQSPKFYLSGATKVQCDSVTFTLDTSQFPTFGTSAYTECFGVGLNNPLCYNSTQWYTKIYEDNNLVYVNNFDTESAYSGYPTDNMFINTVVDAFQTLNYAFTHTGATFTLPKPYGVEDVRVDVSINFPLSGIGVCPAGYTATTNYEQCQKISVTGSSVYGIIYTGVSADTTSSYNYLGARFYEKIDLTKTPINVISGSPCGTNGVQTLYYNNGSGTTFNLQASKLNDLWGSGTTGSYSSRGRLNNIGIWASTSVTGVTDGTCPSQFIGFSHCLDIPSGGTYSIGIAGNNYVKFKINGQQIVNFDKWYDNFCWWHVFPIDLKSGLNVIELTGADQLSAATKSAASFGAEIYSASTSVLSGLTSTTQLDQYIVFSTKDKFNTPFDVGETSGYYCPSGYTLSTCNGYTCVKIQNTGFTQSCSGTCTSDLLTTADVGFPYINNASQGVYIVDGGINTTASIPVTFNFTGNTSTFTANSASFKYKIYKYSTDSGLFVIPPVYESDLYGYSSLTDNKLSLNIPLTNLSLDGDYLVKGYFDAPACTDFLSRLGKTIDTSDYIGGTSFQLYNSDLDYYFVAITKADTPQFSESQVSGTTQQSRYPLNQEVILVDEGTANFVDNGYTRTGSTFTLSSTYVGDILVTLNGLSLAKNVDYTINDTVLTFIGPIHIGDVITIVYTRNSTTTLISDFISVNTTIVSGVTNGEGTNTYYYNTDTEKYEIYTQRRPISGSNFIVILNGITLASNIDYYQSTSNPKRIILIGEIMIGDIITIVYTPQANVMNGITQPINTINWFIANQQNSSDGSFYLQYSNSEAFSSYVVSDTVAYQPYVTAYSGTLTLSGTVGTKWYYRVKNVKDYKSICGDAIQSTAYSEVIPVVIQSNSINSY